MLAKCPFSRILQFITSVSSVSPVSSFVFDGNLTIDNEVDSHTTFTLYSLLAMRCGSNNWQEMSSMQRTELAFSIPKSKKLIFPPRYDCTDSRDNLIPHQFNLFIQAYAKDLRVDRQTKS